MRVLYLRLKRRKLGFKMGGCFSDVKGAKEAVGGVNQKATNNNNDAVDFFYTSQGFQPLFTRVEVRSISPNLSLQSVSGILYSLSIHHLKFQFALI